MAVKRSKVLRARKRVAMDIADHIEVQFGLGIGGKPCWDKDECRRVIEAMMPLNNAEAQAEYDAQMSGGKEQIGPQKPSLPDRLRKAMGMDTPPVSLTQLFEAAAAERDGLLGSSERAIAACKEAQRIAGAAIASRDAANDALRSLASFVGAGGYNASTVDAAAFERKIRDGIDALTAPLQKEVERLRAELNARNSC